MEAALTGPDDPDGSGSLEILANGGRGEMCYVLRTYNIETPTAVHLHQSSGGVEVFTLTLPFNGYTHGCVVGLDSEIVRDIARAPDTYYVVVHTNEFPNGAIRGTLFARQGKPRW